MTDTGALGFAKSAIDDYSQCSNVLVNRRKVALIGYEAQFDVDSMRLPVQAQDDELHSLIQPTGIRLRPLNLMPSCKPDRSSLQ